ncbi:glycerol kinase GlpK [uncultured Desulfuromonas sp.]|uniref:glycerol kinase GlpK n=1 Tax=uncultured Desulfuromonas sp. TaxID=181013 RepID=UPI002AAA83D8|nr:glycerol kinase GlpK [uncultured Desulfuromonas sp.]
MTSYVLAVDQGTTGTTVLVFDREGAVCGHAYSEFGQSYPQPGWVEHDAEEIWAVTLRVMRKALDQGRISPEKIRSIGITNQRETVVVWDRLTSRPIAPAIVWQDRRTADFCAQLKGEGLEADWQQRTGLRIDPYFSATKLHWLLQQSESLSDRARQGELAFGTIDSWLLWKLSGGRYHATDVTNASRTLLYDIHQGCWSDAILRRLDIPEAILPQVKPSAGFITETAPDLFDGVSIPVCGVAGDQQAALFGQICHQPGMAKNTYGTGSFLLLNTGTTPVICDHLLTTIAWQLEGGPVTYALEGSIFVTGAAVQWLRDGLGLLDDAADSAALAESVAGNDDVYFVPALTGLGAPYWDPYARGVMVGLTRGTTRAHLVRAVLESMVYQVTDVARVMSCESGVALTELRADGGAVSNAFLMQFQADILGVPVIVPPISETTAFGAAALAGLAEGVWTTSGDLQRCQKGRQCYEAVMPRRQADQLMTRWSEAVALSRGWAR